MKKIEKASIIILIFLFIVFSLAISNGFICYNLGKEVNIIKTSSNPISFLSSLKSSKLSDKIRITGNSGWTAFKDAGKCTGEGTASNPYVINGLEIDGGGSGSCLWIEDSNVFFTVENCDVANAGGNTDDAGIKLMNVYNGKIVHNFMHDNAFGLYLEACENITVVGNIVTDNTLIGAKIMFTNHSMFYLNSFQNPVNDFYFDFSYMNSYNSQSNITYIYDGETYESYVGNYWAESGFHGEDAGHDGIGDTPKKIHSHFHDCILIDYYPMMEPIGNYQYRLNPSDLIMSGFVITNPTEFSELVSGQQCTITWTSYGPISSVTIELYRGEQSVEVIASSTENDGSFDWIVGSYKTGEVYRIYIQDVNNIVVNMMTEFFVISAAVIPGYDIIYVASLLCLASMKLLLKQFKTSKIRRI